MIKVVTFPFVKNGQSQLLEIQQTIETFAIEQGMIPTCMTNIPGANGGGLMVVFADLTSGLEDDLQDIVDEISEPEIIDNGEIPENATEQQPERKGM